MLKRLLVAAILLAAPAAYGQATWPTPNTPQGGPTVTGGVGLCLNALNFAVPCSVSTPSYTAPANGDPCGALTRTSTSISIGSAIGTRIITGTTAKKTYICYIAFATGLSNNVAIVEGTAAGCGSNTLGVIGGTTTGAGIILAANGSWALGNGSASVANTAVAANDFCLITSSNGPLSGVVISVQQ